MKSKYFHLILYYLVCAKTTATNDGSHYFVGQNQLPYTTEKLNDEQFLDLSKLSNKNHLKETTKQILIPRVVGSEGHRKVRNFIIKNLKDLQWSIEVDSFNDTAPIKGNLEFHNIIATLNPNAERYLVLACHYDSKYMADVEFVGATDSAVPCAMLLNLAEVLNYHLKPFRDSKLSLMLLFFDGEEAFENWGPKDSIYGARHLAKKWESQGFIHKIDMLVLLDLLGAPDPKFYSFFQNTESWYERLVTIEERLASAGLMEHYASSGVTRFDPDRYFQPNALRSSFIEDDHVPFLQRNVPILHLIPVPFPSVWHTKDDNESIIDYNTIENLSGIIRLFTMEYLRGILNK